MRGCVCMDAIGTKRVSEVIDFDRDIKDNRLIRLFAGVGAGKNYWTVKLAQQGYRVLLITSRVATAQAQAEKMGADRWINFDRLFEPEDIWGEASGFMQRKVVCTNSHIQKFVTDRYDPNNEKTHIWNKFDFIILDEAHSLTEDATFSEAPFYVEKFLHYAYKHGKDCHVVIMTGTPEPIEWLFSKEELQEKVHTLDMFKECVHVEPEEVIFYPLSGAIERLRWFYQKGERVIYFSNTTKRISEIVKELTEQGISEDDIGVSYSNDKRDELFSKTLVAKKERIKESLATTELVPEDVKILLTTTKNKEGINNDDIKIMLSESHKRADLVQMAGRVRNGLKYFTVLFDAVPHSSKSSLFKETLNRDCLGAVKKAVEHYKEKCAANGLKFDMKKVIEEVHDTFADIRYDNLTEDFYLYRGRIYGEQQLRHDNALMKSYTESLDAPVFDYGQTGREMLQNWFPYSKIVFYTEIPKTEVEEKVYQYLTEHNLLDRRITREERDTAVVELNTTLSQFSANSLPQALRLPFKTLGPALKKFGYDITEDGRHGEGWIITKSK